MNYEKKYQEIIAAYNADKDRATVEETFARLLDIANSLDEEQRRAVELGLTEEQLALFDLLRKESLTGAEREKIKQESRNLLADLKRLIAPLEQWTEKEQTQAEVEVFILDHVYQALPEPPYTAEDKKEVAALVYRHIWQQSASGLFGSSHKTAEAP
jgi:type I restriction enzyme R subunit